MPDGLPAADLDVEDAGLPLWLDNKEPPVPVVSAWATPDPARAAPTPSVRAAVPNQAYGSR
ncbi:hypothetical protein [Mycolicibacterium sphagni]|uniref:hypothetical protein n=1 Tax=Mycolicibacterium sphagni TaxID=1786 RepID=UPI0013FE4C79|nr:hypothetical protein [Mycolicibacterium sphagni]